ncbi:MarR family winged helix-turn-helix transcriptional regulator [Luethyella okanaganae]|uniref:MarR family winged helix-turn-helix transcriptional regulator n=1 Tax=Luethyella okanaganae TaxID=69372 RepID=A0ABW1VIU4_9MICO
MDGDEGAGVGAIRAWLRLNAALAEFDRRLRAEFGVTGGQLAILRIIGEGETTLARLRAQLVMHPATLGQLIDRVAKLGFVVLDPSPEDRRSRRLRLTEQGRSLVRDAPLAGPVRLRATVEVDRARRLAVALEDAVELFGLDEWALS